MTKLKSQSDAALTRLESIEKDYWWEIKSYLENPSKEVLVDLLEQVYDDGYNRGVCDVDWCEVDE